MGRAEGTCWGGRRTNVTEGYVAGHSNEL
jgi:hypothetical protein